MVTPLSSLFDSRGTFMHAVDASTWVAMLDMGVRMVDIGQ